MIFLGKVDKRKIGRGNPLLSRRRIKTMDKVNEELARIKIMPGNLTSYSSISGKISGTNQHDI
ncbi:MAG: hypothetical protein V8Q83_00440 [Blautia sp.]